VPLFEFVLVSLLGFLEALARLLEKFVAVGLELLGSDRRERLFDGFAIGGQLFELPLDRFALCLGARESFGSERQLIARGPELEIPGLQLRAAHEVNSHRTGEERGDCDDCEFHEMTSNACGEYS